MTTSSLACSHACTLVAVQGRQQEAMLPCTVYVRTVLPGNDYYIHVEHITQTTDFSTFFYSVCLPLAMSSQTAPESYHARAPSDIMEYDEDEDEDEMNFVDGEASSTAYQSASENEVESQVPVDDRPAPAPQREQKKR